MLSACNVSFGYVVLLLILQFFCKVEFLLFYAVFRRTLLLFSCIYNKQINQQTNQQTNQRTNQESQPASHPTRQPASQSHSFFGQSLRLKHLFPFILGSLCFYSHHQHIYLRDVLMTSENELTKIVDYIVFVYFCSSIIVVYFVRVDCMLCIWPN